MKTRTKFKIIILSPLRWVKLVFNFLFPQVITLKCKTCGELKNVEKYIYIARDESIRKNKTLEPHLDLQCGYCKEKKFQLSKKKGSKFKIFFLFNRFLSTIFASTWNAIVFIFGNLLAEFWKLIIRFWREDIYNYLKTIISFFGLCVGSIILSHLLGLDIIVAIALTFAFFVVSVIRNIINRRN